MSQSSIAVKASRSTCASSIACPLLCRFAPREERPYPARQTGHA